MARRACILGCAGARLSPRERAFFAEADPWGFILFARNVETPAQVRRLCDDLRASVGRDAPVLVDQEGGRVQRLGPPHWRQWAPPLDDAASAGARAAQAFRLRYRLIAAELKNLGIDVNCAPCADLALPSTHPFLRNRCYGAEPERVAELARAVADGLLAGGVLPVLKHVPGHGRAVTDSHLEPARVSTPLEELRALDFAPFRALNDLPLAMASHVIYEAVDEVPATFSPAVVQLVREELGICGLLMTDDISMQALSGTVAERTRKALSAGFDLVVHCNGDLSEMLAVASEAEDLSPEAARRADRALSARSQPESIDIAALEAEFHRLMNVAADD